jgi:hypothetical protein
MTRLDWQPILARAAAIVASYDTGVTLRQLFYRLVADGTLANTQAAYKGLSRETAKARREGWFPPLLDLTRRIEQRPAWENPADAVAWLTEIYGVDRTAGQPWQVWLGMEKATLVAQVQLWFGDLGVPVVAVRGYGSQTYLDDIAERAIVDGRPAVLIYAGDLDPSGEDIDRDFISRTACWDEIERVAVNDEDVSNFGLIKQPGKGSDSRAGAFIERHGSLYQVEVEAMDPNDLRTTFQVALDRYWDGDAYAAALEREEADLEQLRRLSGEVNR